jgi:hypothetical protein
MKFKLNCFKTTDKYCIGGAFQIPVGERKKWSNEKNVKTQNCNSARKGAPMLKY